MDRLRIALLAAVTALASMPAAAAPARGKKAKARPDSFLVHPDAKVHYKVAGKYAEKGDLRAAAAELDATYAIEPHPELLFIRAELRRRLEECVVAVALYEEFIASTPSESATRQARDGITACEPMLPKPEPEPEPAPVAPPPEPVAPPPEPTRPWHRDPAGAVLLAFGVVAVAAAGGLVVPAMLERGAAIDAGSESIHAEHRETSIALQWSAGAVGIVGAALLVGAALRYHKVRRGRPRVSGWFDGRGAGVAIVGRF